MTLENEFEVFEMVNKLGTNLAIRFFIARARYNAQEYSQKMENITLAARDINKKLTAQIVPSRESDNSKIY
jgi:hypothetical protein